MMQHNHSHRNQTEHQGDGRLVLAILVNVLLTVAQVVGGAAKRALKEVLQKDYSISHTTLEMEPPGECQDKGTSCAGDSGPVIRKE